MKDDILNVLKDPRDKLIAVDMDGVLCSGRFWTDEECSPIQSGIDLVWKLFIGGAHIIIHTARQPQYYAKTLAWLIAHNVPFHGIAMFVKPGADAYIDDRSLNIDDAL